MPLFNPPYLCPLKFVEVIRVFQIALSGISVFSININEDIGVGPSTKHVTSEDTHFVGVDCQTIEGIEMNKLRTPLEPVPYVGQETVSNQTMDVHNINTEYKKLNVGNYANEANNQIYQ